MDVTAGTGVGQGPVDWGAAGRLGARLAAPGPSASRAELVALVASLRTSADVAAGHVSRITRLTPEGGPGVALVQVVDRAGWVLANARLLDAMTSPGLGGSTSSRTTRLAGAAQVGAALSLLAGKVLGQYDPFTADARAPHGRLLVVAPNVLQVERSLGLDPADFRLWVALHEQTHALQFAAAPWLADHLRARAATLLQDLAPEGSPTPGPPLADVVRTAVKLVLGPRGGAGEPGVLDLLTPAQRVLVDEVGAVMSLLEGHADVAMDAVGPSVVPSVRYIRRRFEARRDAGARARGPQRVLRRLLALDAKLAQYRDGAVFVRTVRRAVGTDGLNAVWSAPALLPTAREIADPRAWVRRVHG